LWVKMRRDAHATFEYPVSQSVKASSRYASGFQTVAKKGLTLPFRAIRGLCKAEKNMVPLGARGHCLFVAPISNPTYTIP